MGWRSCSTPFHEGIADHVKDGHLGIFNSTVVGIVDDDGLGRDISQTATLGTNQGNGFEAVLGSPIHCLDQVG